MAKNDPAFPTDGFTDEDYQGLTKLEWFAGMAKLSDVEMFYEGADTNYRSDQQRAWVKARFDFAEAMLAEAERRAK